MGSCLSSDAASTNNRTATPQQGKEGTPPKANEPFPSSQLSSQQEHQQQPPTTTLVSGSSLSSSKIPIKEYYTLKKTEPRCTGLFWREDPTGQTRLMSGDNWPRDFAKLKGKIIMDKFNEEWLLVTHIMQPDETSWKLAPEGAAIAFEEDQYYLE